MRTKFAANFVASAASATELFLLSAAQGLRRSGVPRACAHVRRRGSVNFSGSRRRRLVDCSVGLGSWVVGTSTSFFPGPSPFASAVLSLIATSVDAQAKQISAIHKSFFQRRTSSFLFSTDRVVACCRLVGHRGTLRLEPRDLWIFSRLATVLPPILFLRCVWRTKTEGKTLLAARFKPPSACSAMSTRCGTAAGGNLSGCR